MPDSDFKTLVELSLDFLYELRGSWEWKAICPKKSRYREEYEELDKLIKRVETSLGR